jgi:hypothetical protein
MSSRIAHRLDFPDEGKGGLMAIAERRASLPVATRAAPR